MYYVLLASQTVSKALKDFKISKSIYYKWKKAFDENFENGHLKYPIKYNHPNKLKEEVDEKVLTLRIEYQLDPDYQILPGPEIALQVAALFFRKLVAYRFLCWIGDTTGI